MKKVLSLLLVIVMVMSSMSMVFATTFEDIDSKNEMLTEVSSLLNGLGIVTGYEDGTFKPSKVVTRAEMAAMLIRAKGYETIANDTPSFSDSQKHWAKGYIALASDLKIINGRGNGIFDPDATVTYQEAATMVLRALGYTDESINGGKSTVFNAANYRTKALSLGVFKDFTFSSINAGAVRGNIALMINRALANSTVYSNEDGRAVVEKDENGNPVKLLNAIAKKQTITVDKKMLAKENLVDLTKYLYQSIDAYIKDEKVIFVDAVNSTVKTGKISATTSNTISLGTGSSKVDYSVKSANESVFYNADEVVYSAAQSALVNASATLVLDSDSKVVGVIASEQTDAKLISSVYKKNSTVLNGIALPTKDGKVDLSKVTVTGEVDAIEDIKANDVVKAFSALNNTAVKLLVVRESVQGKVIKSNNDGSSVFVDTIEEYRDVVNGTLALNDAGTFFLDENGNIFAFSKTSSETNSDFAMITEINNGVFVGDVIIKNPTIKVINAKGEKSTLTIAEDAVLDVLAANGTVTTSDKAAYTTSSNSLVLANELKAGAIIHSVVTEDKQVTKVVLQTLATVVNNVNVTSKTFDPASDIVIFNQYKVNGKDVFAVSTLEDLVALKTITASEFTYIANENGEYTVILVNGSAVVAPKSTVGVIADQQKVVNADGKVVHQLVTYINGEKVTYLSNEDLGKTNIKSDSALVEFTLANGVVTKVAAVSTSSAINVGNVASPIKYVTEDTFVNGTTKYFMNDDATIYVYDEDGNFLRVGSTSDLEGLDLTINLYLNAQNNRLVDNIVVIVK